jgi:hypothetical protein
MATPPKSGSTAPSSGEVKAAQSYLATSPVKVPAHKLAASSKELGKSLDGSMSFLRSLYEGQTNEAQQQKERLDAISGAKK